MKFAALLTASATVALAISSAQAVIIIDDFTVTATTTQVGVGTNPQDVAAPGVLGGSRRQIVTVQSGAGSAALNVNTNVPGAMSLSSEANVDASFTAVYGATTDLNANLAPENAIIIRVLGSDIGGTANSITINSSSGSSTATFTVPSLVGFPGGPVTPYDIVIPYASFSGTGDFSDVDRITFSFNLPRDGDWSLDFFAASDVPEPTALGLLAPAGALLARRRRA